MSQLPCLHRPSLFQRALALLLCVASLPLLAQAHTFSAVIDKMRLSLTCEGPIVIDTPCQIGTSTSDKLRPVRFTAPSSPNRHAHLLKRGLARVLSDAQQPRQLSASEIQVLRSLVLDSCHPADGSNEMSGDLLQICSVPNSADVVLFMRALCDGCQFEPVILKKNVVAQ
jgi:hypothetical protein